MVKKKVTTVSTTTVSEEFINVPTNKKTDIIYTFNCYGPITSISSIISNSFDITNMSTTLNNLEFSYENISTTECNSFGF